MGGTSYSRGGLHRDKSLAPKNTFGIIPTLTAEAKMRQREEFTKRMKNLRVKNDDEEKSFAKRGIDESPTSMKMKNTFIL